MENDEKVIRRALIISSSISALIALGIIITLVLLGGEEQEIMVDEAEVTGPRRSELVVAPTILLTDITSQSGIDFSHTNGAYGSRMLPETMGGGIAFFDYNNDSHQDLLLINSTNWPWTEQPTEGTSSKLYRGKGDGTFEDVTEQTGLDLQNYGMGVAIGDYDGDGWSDIFVTTVGRNLLFKNISGNRFKNVTRSLGVAGPEDSWSTSAAFFDFDRDGDLDLFVCNYVVWSKAINESVDYRLTGLGNAYGPPTDFAGTNSILYRNDGSKFSDVSENAGVRVANELSGAPVGKGLAVHPLDVNGDGWLDVVVANDTVRNFLFINQRNGKFEESGVSSGLAFDNSGSATGAMGIDAAYYANDERLGITIGNFSNEMSSFYVKRGQDSVFSDNSIVAGIGAYSRKALTFGTIFVDLDLDGRLDLVAANGHVEPEINRVQSSQYYEQPLHIFWNCGDSCSRTYQPASNSLNPIKFVGRGASYADIDSDGDTDLAITQTGGSFVLLRNDQTSQNHWIRVTLVGKPPNPEAIGAKVIVYAGGTEQTRSIMPTRSYLTQVELPLTFGLGTASSVNRVEVLWPNGFKDVYKDLTINQNHIFLQR